MSLPIKRIISPDSLEAFLQSPTHNEIVNFIETLNQACTNVKLSDSCPQSAVLQAMLSMLDSVSGLINETPPVDNKASRFGNPAFKTLYDKIQSASSSLHASIPGLPQDRIPELSVYFTECWGNRTRIDYGSGMELNFLCWMMCLCKLGLVEEADHQALVTKVFWKYMEVMRVIQSQYWLEPAGSHGVWGLDDYHFLPFLFGAAQLKGHKHITPKSIHNPDILAEFSKDYMYLACIKFINDIKTASLRWHSPMLDDISGVKTWDKVNSGLIKMYKAEVLAKLPVAQHIYFGPLLPFPIPLEAEKQHDVDGGVQKDEHGHIHVRGEMWGDCCGIAVPAAFGAAQSSNGQRIVPISNTVKRVPFD